MVILHVDNEWTISTNLWNFIDYYIKSVHYSESIWIKWKPSIVIKHKVIKNLVSNSPFLQLFKWRVIVARVLRLDKRKKKFSVSLHYNLSNTVDSCYLEVQGTVWNTSRYPYLDISDLQNWGKNKSNNRIKRHWICNLSLYLKYCGKEENFSPFPQYLCGSYPC